MQVQIECNGCGALMVRRGQNHKWCADCKPAREREYRQAYRDKIGAAGVNAAARAAYATNRAHRREMALRLRLADPEAYAAYQRTWRARKSAESRMQARAWRHRTTVDAIEGMWADQGGRCPICQGVLPDDFHFDHDHKTGAVRGLLCAPCNKGLGHFRDDAERLRRAADYLDCHAMEFFTIHDSPGSEHFVKPYAPSHGPGSDPYLVREIGTGTDQRTSFRGELNS